MLTWIKPELCRARMRVRTAHPLRRRSVTAVVVAGLVYLLEPFEEAGARLPHEVSPFTDDVAANGTTTATTHGSQASRKWSAISASDVRY
ncbi:hypothetical protein LJR034_008761 [Caballeronia sp. LjRoot34]|uniref:hypothetical protein n=1 Tax=Caballeronia sp. LjRoot34 TaxID=3342325 RepID=UPI003ECE1167